MFKKIITIVLLGVMMATLMSVILGCEDIDSKTANAIQDKLAEKYGESFTVTSLGDRIGYDTVTAYVYADNDPSMRFTAKLDKNLELVFDDYSYRFVCRKTDKLVESIFSQLGLDVCSYCTYEYMDNSLGLTITPSDYIDATSSTYLSLGICVKDGNGVTGEQLLDGIFTLREQLGDILIGAGVYVLSIEDYNTVHDKIVLDTELFGLTRLNLHGAKDQIRNVIIRCTADGSSLTIDQIDEALNKGAE